MRRSKESMKLELDIHCKNLDTLKVQIANYGIKVPLDLANEIDHIEKAMARLEAKLEKFNKTQPRIANGKDKFDIPIELTKKIEHIEKAMARLEAKLEKINETKPRIANITDRIPKQPPDATTQPWLWMMGTVLVILLCVGGLAVVMFLSNFGDGTPTPLVVIVPTFIPTHTPRPPTSTPTSTTRPPTSTLRPPTSTLRPPTSTLRPPTSTPTSTPTLSAGSIKTRNIDGMTMLYVPGGMFKMGSANSDTQANSDEKPQHNVTVNSFWIDKTEMTNAQYQLCVSAGKCRQSKYVGNSTYNRNNYPVVGVDWNDAHSYCQWTEGRLPTEAEWEYAARGKAGRIYPWGNKFDRTKVNGIEAGNGYAITAPVGSYPGGASWVGALDMSGNVWEWVQSKYKGYPYNPTDGRENVNRTSVLVVRGGSWYDGNENLRTTSRFNLIAYNSANTLGFRCVADIR